MHRLCLSRIDADVKSFKVTVNSENRDKLLDGNLWPENVHVRKYFSQVVEMAETTINNLRVISFNCNIVLKLTLLGRF